MSHWQPATLTTWGRTRFARVSSVAPPTEAEIASALIAASDLPITLYGAGRCYGDAALGAGGRTIQTGQLNQILEFDPVSGDVVCEAGVTFRALADRFFSQNYCYPVAAATSAVTVGGAFANDIHSKNHHSVGSFGDHTNWIDLMLASGEVRRCSREQNSDLFRATLGGIGLTGIVLRVCFKMMKLASGSVDATYVPQRNLAAMIAAIEAGREQDDFLFGWVDTFAKGADLGRGILESGRFAPNNDGVADEPKPWTVPLAPPSFLVSPKLLSWYTHRRYQSLPAAGKAVRLKLFPFLFPLDHVRHFNRVYGHKGFYSIHAGFPRASQSDGIHAMLTEIAEAQAGSMTAVVKPLRGPGAGLLSFPLEGMAFAVDLPARRGTPDLHRRLEEITLAHAGRLYVAKDALMTVSTYRAMFPNLIEFQGIAALADPDFRFQSDLSRRLILRPHIGDE